MKEQVKIKGWVVGKIKNKQTGEITVLRYSNLILGTARNWMAGCAAGSFPNPVSISHMIFGDGGTENGKEKEVEILQANLFGVTRAKKKVVARIDPEMPNEVIFTASLEEDDATGHVLNEMALQLSNGELFSMLTFPGLQKTEQLGVIEWDWYVSFV